MIKRRNPETRGVVHTEEMQKQSGAALYLITYLARVDHTHVAVYDAQGFLSEVRKATKLIERDVCLTAKDNVSAIRAVEEEDPAFVRLLKSTVVPRDTVVHLMDRTHISERV